MFGGYKNVHERQKVQPRERTRRRLDSRRVVDLRVHLATTIVACAVRPVDMVQHPITRDSVGEFILAMEYVKNGQLDQFASIDAARAFRILSHKFVQQARS